MLPVPSSAAERATLIDGLILLGDFLRLVFQQSLSDLTLRAAYAENAGSLRMDLKHYFGTGGTNDNVDRKALYRRQKWGEIDAKGAGTRVDKLFAQFLAGDLAKVIPALPFLPDNGVVDCGYIRGSESRGLKPWRDFTLADVFNSHVFNEQLKACPTLQAELMTAVAARAQLLNAGAPPVPVRNARPAP